MMVSAGSILVKILTPLGVVLHEEASMVIIPGVEGEAGILPSHVSTIFKLDPGLVKVYSNEKITNELFVFGGFAKVDQDQLYILVDKTSTIEELDADKARKDLESLERELLQCQSTDLLPLIETKIRLATKIIEISKK